MSKLITIFTGHDAEMGVRDSELNTSTNQEQAIPDPTGNVWEAFGIDTSTWPGTRS